MSDVEIHELQIKTIKEVLSRERNNHGVSIIFIHGKGDGVLRKELIDILKKNPDLYKFEDASFRKYDYQAATKVIIR